MYAQDLHENTKSVGYLLPRSRQFIFTSANLLHSSSPKSSASWNERIEMTEIKISCLDGCLYMRKCDGDENKQGVKMAISSNDVQLILLCGWLSIFLSLFHEKFIFSYSFLWWSRKIQIFHSRHLMMVLIISYYLHYQMSQ